ncbi:hypothetical protein [Chryseobacterium koreense]|uniref:hypothetical protein n=1 Tax=Chryseobacterium koreense TaxID=232216 RepID=UPI00161CCDC1|nr:hypothetical protein [Chryseobacterium koreense]MBB5333568.1 hypothetical protein [Chryseobacterium koreense]
MVNHISSSGRLVTDHLIHGIAKMNPKEAVFHSPEDFFAVHSKVGIRSMLLIAGPIRSSQHEAGTACPEDKM